MFCEYATSHRWKTSYPFIQNSLQTVFGVAGFRPGRRGPLVSAKGPKTIDAQSDLIRIGRPRDTGGRSNSLRSNKARRRRRAPVPLVGQQASETNAHHTMGKVADMRRTEGAEQMESSVFCLKSGQEGSQWPNHVTEGVFGYNYSVNQLIKQSNL